ncbi:DUF2244 domain-containing protein [Aquabacterium sp. J223]|uniref:DUF2244 domain-containing protein n=1 Tax=Aquabacterium sp. J223 TaxID=2898431 RepID=UPI0021AD56A9|nr:DUF2244 domain-containing protein [Aquabacterium sp. J223]UUX95058.1 DUF2244 domain-containing protein [Aquabacterium sp. J223]
MHDTRDVIAMPPLMPADDGSLRWELRRNCRLTPRQLLVGCGALAGVLLAVGAGFALLGLAWVTAFAVVEALVVAGAVVAYARHAADREILVLRAGELHVEQHDGARRRHLVLPAKAARVEAPAGPGALVTVRGPGGAEVRLGRHLRQHDRSVLAHDLRRALLQAG